MGVSCRSFAPVAVVLCGSALAAAGSYPASRAEGAAGCRPTIPNGSTPPGERRSGAHHGNGKLWLATHVRGELVVSREVNDHGPGLQSDGTIRAKYPWFGSARAGRRLKLTGVTLDGEPARLRSEINQRSRARSPRFWPTIVRYPRPGCWRVTGRAGNARLSLVIRVRFEDQPAAD